VTVSMAPTKTGWESGRYFGASWESFGLADGGGDGLGDVIYSQKDMRDGERCMIRRSVE